MLKSPSVRVLLALAAGLGLGMTLAAFMPWVPAEALGPIRLGDAWHVFGLIGVYLIVRGVVDLQP